MSTPDPTTPKSSTPLPAVAPVATPSTLSTIEADVQADVAKVKVELGFVEANWGKLSLIVVASGIVGAVIGHIL